MYILQIVSFNCAYFVLVSETKAHVANNKIRIFVCTENKKFRIMGFESASYFMKRLVSVLYERRNDIQD
jgi:hypothetical protein